MGLFAVAIEGEYSDKRKANKICILIEAKSLRDSLRQAQNIFLQKFPDDYITDSNSIKITLDATKKNPSSRSPVEEVKENATSSN